MDHNDSVVTRAGLPTASDYQVKIFEAIENAIRQIIEGDTPTSLIIEAKPGSGKTTTGVAATHLIPKGIPTIFVAFNKKIADELAIRLPPGIGAKTFHAHWLRQWGRRVSNRHKVNVNVEHFKVRNAVDRLFGFTKFNRNAKKNASPDDIIELRRKRKFADQVVFLVEKAKLFGVVPENYPDAHSVGDYEDNDFFWSHMVEYFDYEIDPTDLPDLIKAARKILWQQLDNEVDVDFADMLYLPAVKNVVGETYHIVLIDEAQDLNGLQRYLLSRMVNQGGMIIAIGDSRQCQPAGTMVSVPGEYSGSRRQPVVTKSIRIENLKVGDKLVSYATTKSHFTGITKQSGVQVEYANSRMYEGYMYTIIVGDKVTKGTNNHRWFVRFNESARNSYAVYLMRKGNNWRVGVSRLLYKHSFGPGQRARDEKADCVYILKVFNTKDQALIEEKLITSRWQIPDVIFEYNNQKPTLKMTEAEYIDFVAAFWQKWEQNNTLDRFAEGLKCLEYHGQDYEYPIWSSNDKSARLGRYGFVVPSVNLIPEVMSMKTFEGRIKGGEWFPITVSKNYVNEKVYSLKVTPLYENQYRHLYVADGIVTHNSIYAFRGADAESMQRIKEDFCCTEYPLSISYRCSKRVVEVAYGIYPEIEAAPNAAEGSVEYPDSWKLDQFQPGHLIICRNNSPTIALAYRLIRQRIPAKVLGRDIGDGLIKLIQRLDVDNTLPELIDRLRGWRDHQITLVERKEPGDERSKEQIRDKYACISNLAASDEITTVRELVNVIDQLFTTREDEKQAVSSSRVTLSTIHKIKGAEADTVFILDSHLINAWWVKGEWQSVQEENLRFVAVTRAKNRLVFVYSEEIKT